MLRAPATSETISRLSWANTFLEPDAGFVTHPPPGMVSRIVLCPCAGLEFSDLTPQSLDRAQLRGGGGGEACGCGERQAGSGRGSRAEPSRAEPEWAPEAGAASSNHVGVREAVRGWRG